jgi:hypothetical protein
MLLHADGNQRPRADRNPAAAVAELLHGAPPAGEQHGAAHVRAGGPRAAPATPGGYRPAVQEAGPAARDTAQEGAAGAAAAGTVTAIAPAAASGISDASTAASGISDASAAASGIRRHPSAEATTGWVEQPAAAQIRAGGAAVGAQTEPVGA